MYNLREDGKKYTGFIKEFKLKNKKLICLYAWSGSIISKQMQTIVETYQCTFKNVLYSLFACYKGNSSSGKQ